MFRTSRAAVLGPAVALIAGLGCETRPPVESSNAKATVRGQVTIKGKPATKGQVVFETANYLRKDSPEIKGEIQPDGSYSVDTLVGLNSVRVESDEAARAGASYDRFDLDVPSGGATLDLSLPKP